MVFPHNQTSLVSAPHVKTELEWEFDIFFQQIVWLDNSHRPYFSFTSLHQQPSQDASTLSVWFFIEFWESLFIWYHCREDFIELLIDKWLDN